MATKKILVIDDEEVQAKALQLRLNSMFEDAGEVAEIMVASSKEQIMDSIENKFYNLAILDIRMDEYDFDGIELAKKIIDINPFAKIIFVSKFAAEYMESLSELLTNGKILKFSEKKEYDLWLPELKEIIENYYKMLESCPSEVNAALLSFYADAKNEPNTFKKGEKYENFVSILFRSIGFNNIQKRVKDRSLNETDLVIRNDIDDSFLAKFGKYILVECKNKPDTNTTKNDFIVFLSKVENTNGLSELGFLFTTSTLTRNTYIEAVRSSNKKEKIVFVDNKIMFDLLSSSDLKECIKKIIDNQVKDN